MVLCGRGGEGGLLIGARRLPVLLWCRKGLHDFDMCIRRGRRPGRTRGWGRSIGAGVGVGVGGKHFGLMKFAFEHFSEIYSRIQNWNLQIVKYIYFENINHFYIQIEQL